MLELFSAINLLAWVQVLFSTPTLFEREGYRSFDSMPQGIWASIFVAIAILQLLGVFLHWSHTDELRFFGFAFAAGAWSAVALSFLVRDVSSTAEMNYVLLALGCMISGAFLGWKSHY